MRNPRMTLAIGTTIVIMAGLGGFVLARSGPQSGQDKPRAGESERQVQATEVPKPALDALKKLAGAAALTDFAEEIEHGHTFYEGSWRGKHGNVDALVTPTGDLVEIEETIPADQAPAAVRDQAKRAAGGDPSLAFEKKTFVMYEIHYRADGRGREKIFTPDGRTYSEEDGDDDGDDDGDEGDNDDGDDDEDDDAGQNAGDDDR